MLEANNEAVSWPAGLVYRAAAFVVLQDSALILIILLEVPLTFVAELRTGLERMVVADAVSGSMIVSRFLMGGGGSVIALAIAVFCLTGARRFYEAGSSLGGQPQSDPP